MQPPLIVRLLFDAEHEIGRAADAVPPARREISGDGMNSPGWILAHASFFLDVWLSADAQGRDLDACDAWSAAWFHRQEASASAIETVFADARGALGRAIDRTAPFLGTLSEHDLTRIPPRIAENGWPEGTTVGYLVSRCVAHLFVHASELNVVATGAGARDLGLPGRLRHTFGSERG